MNYSIITIIIFISLFYNKNLCGALGSFNKDVLKLIIAECYQIDKIGYKEISDQYKNELEDYKTYKKPNYTIQQDFYRMYKYFERIQYNKINNKKAVFLKNLIQNPFSFCKTVFALYRTNKQFSSLINDNFPLSKLRIEYFFEKQLCITDSIFIDFYKETNKLDVKDRHDYFCAIIESQYCKFLFCQTSSLYKKIAITSNQKDLLLQSCLQQTPCFEALFLKYLLKNDRGVFLFDYEGGPKDDCFTLCYLYYKFFHRDLNDIIILGLLYNPYLDIKAKKEILDLLQQKKSDNLPIIELKTKIPNTPTIRDFFVDIKLDMISTTPHLLLLHTLEQKNPTFAFLKDDKKNFNEQDKKIALFFYLAHYIEKDKRILGDVFDFSIHVLEKKYDFAQFGITDDQLHYYKDLITKNNESNYYIFLKKLFKEYRYEKIVTILYYLNTFIEKLKDYRIKNDHNVFKYKIKSYLDFLLSIVSLDTNKDKKIDDMLTFDHKLFAENFI